MASGGNSFPRLFYRRDIFMARPAKEKEVEAPKTEAKKVVMVVNVRHNLKDYLKDSEVPEELVELFLDKKYAEEK